MKGYIKNIKFRNEPHGKWIDVDFCRVKEEAGCRPTRQAAEEDAGMLEYHDVAIITAEGQRHICKRYKVEERAPEEFVICVDAPFIGSGTDQPQPNTPKAE